MNDLLQAARDRHSVRQYTDRPLDEQTVGSLRSIIDGINAESGLNIRLVLNEPSAFGGFALKGFMKFRNAVNYFVIAGPDSLDLDRKAGYWGERLVLEAQCLGLGTCWAMMAKKKKAESEDRTVILISVGYPENPGVPHKSKPIEKFGEIESAPDWFVQGIECAMLAPTGVNRQGFSFDREGSSVRIDYGRSTLSSIDAGIAMFHFELGAGKENFEWANPLE